MSLEQAVVLGLTLLYTNADPNPRQCSSRELGESENAVRQFRRHPTQEKSNLNACLLVMGVCVGELRGLSELLL